MEPLTTPATDLSTPEEPSGVKVKQERQDEKDTTEDTHRPPEAKKAKIPDFSSLRARNVTVTVASGSKETSNQKAPEKTTPEKPEPPPIDYPSICGAFGWTTIGSVHLPFIMRGEDRFVAVRMVECKIISNYADVLPWTVFTCTNIKSYYITENEAKLLNEINGFHCEFQFGYQTFSAKDVVVRLKDTVKFYEFLETCKTKLNLGERNTAFNDHCGFFIINYTPVPFVKKGTKKYIPLNMVYQDDIPAPVPTPENITEWDLAYLRFLSSIANIDQRKFKLDAQLCCVEELQNVLGISHFEEWWPNMQYASKNDGSRSSSDMLSKWGDAFPVIHTTSPCIDSTQKIRDKMSEMQEKESMLNSFLGLNKYLDLNRQPTKPAHISRSHNEQPNNMNCLQSHEKSQNLFPTSLESLLATSSPCNFPYAVNYRTQYGNPLQTSVAGFEHCSKNDGISSLATSRPRPFPPPPPLVRLSGSRTPSVQEDHNMVMKTSSSLYPYLQAAASDTTCPPWLARILEPEWFREQESRTLPRLQTTEAAENLSRRLSNEEAWCAATSLSSNTALNGAGSSSVRNNGVASSIVRDGYDLSNPSLCRDERVLVHPHGGSPRLLAGPGPPPHYPTPPQSSPLQPMSILDCATMAGVTDLYTTRSTPNGLANLCSPPPSPEIRSALSNSPRTAAHLSSYGYQPHVTRLVQVDSRYVLAINIEPHKYNSHLAVPILDVVNKFLRGTSVQSCQIMLETVFGLHLYECTSLQQEAFTKHNMPISPGSKLVSLTDLKNCLYQLKFLLVEREKQKEKQCDIGASELPLSKRWCGTDREI